MGTTYIINESFEYYDQNEGDARGFPVKKWYSSERFETRREYEVGDSWISKKNGKFYRCVVQSVHSKGMVWEETEELDVEIYAEEIKDYCPPDNECIDKFLFKAESGHKVVTGYLPGDEKNIDLVIPNTVEEIANEAFMYLCIKSVTIPDSVKVIGNNAFEGCSITHVDFGHEVETIGHEAFKSCKQLESIALPDSLKSIGREVFWGCTSLKKVSFPKHTSGIKKLHGTFEFCSSLEYIEVPDTVELYQAFRFCEKLQSIRIPAGQKVIERTEFYDCKSLTSIVIPDSVEKIEDDAFHGCTSLKAIVIPASVKHIDSLAFYGCTSLEHVSFLGKLEFLGYDVFEGCPAEIEVPFDRQVLQNLPEKIDKYFMGNQLLTSVELPPTVKVIGRKAFCGCKNLVSVKIPYSVTSIGDDAFSSCDSLESIELPEGLTEIGARAFRYCHNLRCINIPKGVKDISSFCFSDCENLKTVFMSREKYELFKNRFNEGTDFQFYEDLDS